MAIKILSENFSVDWDWQENDLRSFGEDVLDIPMIKNVDGEAVVQVTIHDYDNEGKIVRCVSDYVENKFNGLIVEEIGIEWQRIKERSSRRASARAIVKIYDWSFDETLIAETYN